MKLSEEKRLEYIDRVSLYCFMGLVFILPFPHTMSLRMWLMFIPCILWFYKMYLTGSKIFAPNKLTVPVVIFLSVIALSLISAVTPKYSFREFYGEALTGFLIFFLFLNNIKNYENGEKIIISLLGGSLVQGLYGAAHYFYKGGNLLDYQVNEGALTAGFISFSVYLITIFPFLFYKLMTSVKRERGFYVFLFLLNLFMLYLTHQRGAWIAFFLELFVFLFFAKRRLIPVIIFLCISLFFVMPKSIIFHGKAHVDIATEDTKNHTNTINSRIALWKFSAREIAKNPFKGIGFGRYSFAEKYPEFKKTEHWHTLNTFLNITIQLGIQGLLAFLFILYRLGHSFLDGLKTSKDVACRYLFLAMFMCLVGFFARNMFDDHYVDDNAIMFWILMGLGMGVYVRNLKSSDGGLSFWSLFNYKEPSLINR